MSCNRRRCWMFRWFRWMLPAVFVTLVSACHDAAADPPKPPSRPLKTSPARVLVAYFSLHGTTEQLAKAVAEGAARTPGTAAVVKKVDEVTKEDLQSADAIALGCPTYYANIPGKMKTVIDDWSWKMKVDFTDKVGAAFATGGGQTGGKEHVVISLLLFMINNRMVVAGPLYQDAEGDDKWAELGATAMTGPLDPGVSKKELDGARRLGQRLGRLAGRFSRAKSPSAGHAINAPRPR